MSDIATAILVLAAAEFGRFGVDLAQHMWMLGQARRTEDYMKRTSEMNDRMTAIREEELALSKTRSAPQPLPPVRPS